MKLSLEGNPRRLLYLFLFFSLLSFVTIMLASYFGIRNIYTNHIMKEAEKDSIHIGTMLFDQERQALDQIDASKKINTKSFVFKQLDQAIKVHLLPFDVIKIKAFSLGHRIIYSNDTNIIGEVDASNDSLKESLKGNIISKTATKDSFRDLANETRLDIDVVETYVPLYRGKDVVGAFELYRDITPYRNGLKIILRNSMFVIGAMLVLTFLILAWLMQIGTKRIQEYEKTLHELAVHDSLTGLLNRRALLTQGDAEFDRTQRLMLIPKSSKHPKQSLGCLMLDLDHFKKINDRYGHVAGDIVLQELAERILSSVRKYDIVGRYGGEEFIIMIPHSTITRARHVAERIWSAVRDLPFTAEKNEIKVTISIGLATLSAKDNSLEDVIKRADKRLYDAKKSGRDKIVWR